MEFEFIIAKAHNLLEVVLVESVVLRIIEVVLVMGSRCDLVCQDFSVVVSTFQRDLPHLDYSLFHHHDLLHFSRHLGFAMTS